MLAGEVTVDGEVVTRLGTKVDPTHRRDPGVGAAGCRRSRRTSTSSLNKPTRRRLDDVRPAGAPRPCSDFVADRPERLFHVGRLDTDTAGLILLTNDGEFAQRMAHPSYEVDKTYVAEVDGARLPAPRSSTLLAGVELDDGPVTVSAATLVGRGRARQVHRRAGHPRGPQPDRAPPARPRRPPGPQAHPHRDRPGPLVGH